MDDKTKEFIKNYAGYLGVGIICLVYVATAVISMGKTDKTFGEIIAEGAASFIVGFVITRLFDVQGLMEGKREPLTVRTLEEHARTVERVEPHLDRLDEWCECENNAAAKTVRVRMLAASGMKYSDYYDDKGEPKPFVYERSKDRTERRERKRKRRAFQRSLRIKLTRLTASLLTGEGEQREDVNYLGQTERDYERSVAIKDAVSKLFLAAVFGYYGVDMVANFSYAVLIWRALQVVSYVCMGILKMYRSRNYILEGYCARVNKKTGYLKKFEIDVNKGELR